MTVFFLNQVTVLLFYSHKSVIQKKYNNFKNKKENTNYGNIKG